MMMTMATTGIYRVCVRNPELGNSVATGVTIEADSLGQAHDIWKALPGALYNTLGDGRYVTLTTERESDYDRAGPQD